MDQQAKFFRQAAKCEFSILPFLAIIGFAVLSLGLLAFWAWQRNPIKTETPKTLKYIGETVESDGAKTAHKESQIIETAMEDKQKYFDWKDRVKAVELNLKELHITAYDNLRSLSISQEVLAYYFSITGEMLWEVRTYQDNNDRIGMPYNRVDVRLREKVCKYALAGMLDLPDYKNKAAMIIASQNGVDEVIAQAWGADWKSPERKAERDAEMKKYQEREKQRQSEFERKRAQERPPGFETPEPQKEFKPDPAPPPPTQP